MSQLTKVQEKMLEYIPENLKADIVAKMLVENAKATAVRDSNREVFSLTVNHFGVIVIRGLGNRFPTGLRVDQLQTILGRSEEINKFISDNKALIETNSKNPRPKKVAAAKLSVAR